MDINTDNIPNHVAIIMDGNGRWARAKGLIRTQGHIEGVKRVEEAIETANSLGIKALTLFTFSTENWSRPEFEVSMLMDTIINVLSKRIDKLLENNIKFSVIGCSENVPESVSKVLNGAIDKTKDNTGMVLNLAFNYGSRREIIDAVKKISKLVKSDELNIEDISESIISQALYTKDLPDPDLLIRTSGEKRISNFLLWQLSYSEFYFTDKHWPDFNEQEFKKAIIEYQSRERRFGDIKAKKELT
ncbi:MAG: isoprenyl transferase [Candidatus Zapsychrus exili]|nr:isoprenyl transferase [Candidatus Zapsychrus exili]